MQQVAEIGASHGEERPPGAVDRAVKALHRGHAIVVLELPDAGAARAQLERPDAA